MDIPKQLHVDNLKIQSNCLKHLWVVKGSSAYSDILCSRDIRVIINIEIKISFWMETDNCCVKMDNYKPPPDAMWGFCILTLDSAAAACMWWMAFTRLTTRSASLHLKWTLCSSTLIRFDVQTAGTVSTLCILTACLWKHPFDPEKKTNKHFYHLLPHLTVVVSLFTWQRSVQSPSVKCND